MVALDDYMEDDRGAKPDTKGDRELGAGSPGDYCDEP